MHLFADDLYSDAFSHSQIKVAGPVGFTAFVTDDTFQISGSANYESRYDKMIQGMLESNKMLEMGHRMATDFGGVQMKNVESTILGWTGSEKPRFSVRLVFPSIDEGMAAKNLATVKLLTSGVYPKGGNDNAVRLTPPMGYLAKMNSNAGRISVQIGEWFLATKQVLTGVDFNYSKEVTPKGLPTYITGTINFEPDRMLTSDTIMQYYLK